MPHSSCFIPQERDPLLIVQEAGWAPGPVWTGVENLAPTAIQPAERPVRSKSLYSLVPNIRNRNQGTTKLNSNRE
jgi:hypothetical protein